MAMKCTSLMATYHFIREDNMAVDLMLHMMKIRVFICLQDASKSQWTFKLALDIHFVIPS